MAFRNATMDDARLLYDWAMDKEVRKNSLSENEFSFNKNISWLEKKMDDSNCHLLIFENIGTARLDIEGQTAIISYSIAKDYRGKGYGKRMLNELEHFAKTQGVLKLQATVKSENLASVKIFESLNYDKEKTKKVFVFSKLLI